MSHTPLSLPMLFPVSPKCQLSNEAKNEKRHSNGMLSECMHQYKTRLGKFTFIAPYNNNAIQITKQDVKALRKGITQCKIKDNAHTIWS